MIYSNYEKAFKQYEELTERWKQANEFWFNSIVSTAKEFFKL